MGTETDRYEYALLRLTHEALYLEGLPLPDLAAMAGDLIVAILTAQHEREESSSTEQARRDWVTSRTAALRDTASRKGWMRSSRPSGVGTTLTGARIARMRELIAGSIVNTRVRLAAETDLLGPAYEALSRRYEQHVALLRDVLVGDAAVTHPAVPAPVRYRAANAVLERLIRRAAHARRETAGTGGRSGTDAPSAPAS